MWWAFLMSIAGPLLAIVAKLMGGGDKNANDQREFGREEQQNADMKADVDVIKRANQAAATGEKEQDDVDPNDLDARR